ncbi:lytic transglycosylase domain-containing protein [Methylosarcina fibrata]|uniref:lytic transglycosylase domain-containing protein n=1 Tax=Methylosarcina fibrata TaxID=105972 RepID=UPI00038292FF|nr:lytic transglycosylase domain-containing protein [Methylosarcina fibrata]
MLLTNLQSRHQSSAQHLSESHKSRSFCQKNYALVLPIFCLGLISFGPSCQAQEKAALPKSYITTVSPKVSNPSPSKLQSTLWWQIAKHHQLDPYILYAVALIESAKGNPSNQVSPWPWAINKSGKPILPDSQQEARVLLNKTLAEGRRNIDVGLMQINLYWHGHRVGKPEQLLNPVTNLQIGALVLAEAIQSAPHDLVLGVGRYHSWQNTKAAVSYGRRVLAVANQIRAVL